MLETRNFLVPDATLVIEMIAFVVVLIVMAKYVLPRIRRAVVQRQEQIATAMSAAGEANRRRDRSQEEAVAVLADARRQAREITDQAWSTRDQLIAEGRQEGHDEYVWLAGRASRETDRRIGIARLSGQQEAIDAAAAAVEHDLGQPVDRHRLVAAIQAQLQTQPQTQSRASSGVPTR